MHKIFIREYIEYSIFVLASNRIETGNGKNRKNDPIIIFASVISVTSSLII